MSSTKISKDYQDGYDLGYKKGYVDGAKEFQPKKGKWEWVQYDANPKIGNWHCSNCRHIELGSRSQKPFFDYCPSCGADMR